MLKLYVTDMRGADELRSKRKGRSPQRGSAFGQSLLEFAVADTWGMPLPELTPPDSGKPLFVGLPNKHFSVSHSKTHVLVALADAPVGVDVETRREISRQSQRLLMTEAEAEQFDFFQLWCLRESLYKLNGTGGLRQVLRFGRQDGRIVGPDSAVFHELLEGIEGCAGAVCMEQPFTVPELIWVEIEKLCN